MAMEVTVISAEALTIGSHHVPAKKRPFVVVLTDSGRSSATTKPDPTGGSYPEWNEKFFVDMPIKSLIVEVRCGNNKVVGVANIPKHDFCGGFLPANYLHFLSYRLRNPNGKANGIINLSVRVMPPSGVSYPVKDISSGIPVSYGY